MCHLHSIYIPLYALCIPSISYIPSILCHPYSIHYSYAIRDIDVLFPLAGWFFFTGVWFPLSHNITQQVNDGRWYTMVYQSPTQTYFDIFWPAKDIIDWFTMVYHGLPGVLYLLKPYILVDFPMKNPIGSDEITIFPRISKRSQKWNRSMATTVPRDRGWGGDPGDGTKGS